MKKTMFGIVAALMIGATAMAQSQDSARTANIMKRTEYVAKKYNLDEAQTKKLLELNTKYADATELRRFPRMGNRRGGALRPRRNPNLRMMQPMRDSTLSRRPRLTEEQRAKFEEMRKKFAERREAYDKELQTIMTAEQYKSYKADMERRTAARLKGRK